MNLSFLLRLALTLSLAIPVYAHQKPKQLACKSQAQAAYLKKYQRIKGGPAKPMSARLNWISRQFLNAPYEMYVLGDGVKDKIDQCPMYRLDAFDCETYVTTVLALAYSKDRGGFERCMRAIRYKEGQVGYLTRNHFTSIDWNHQNQKQGRLKDITVSILDEQKHPVHQWSKTWIDKAAWFRQASEARMRLTQTDAREKETRMAWLIENTKDLPRVKSSVPYIPLEAFFHPDNRVNQVVVDQIPDGAIIEIVRPNWSLVDKIGTNLDISHLGFAFRHDGKLWFRNASYLSKKVIDEPLVDYLDRARKSPTIRGVNVQVALMPEKHRDLCKG